MTAVKISRRQRLDEEYKSLLSPGSDDPLCFYGPSLITVIFNARTIVDATLFFISGAHNRYRYTPTEVDGAYPVLDVHFANPRIPSFFTHLLPEEDEPRVTPKKTRKPKVTVVDDGKKRPNQRARKRCAFFNIKLTKRGDPPAILSADVKLFNGTVHVCGLRDPRDAELIMGVIHGALVENQALLESTDPEVVDLLAGGDEDRRAFLSSNKRCCTVPLVLSEGDVVMTNICGKFTKTLNLRRTYTMISEEWPTVHTYLTTMSKSNYLAVTLFEHPPFSPMKSRTELTEEQIRVIMEAKHSYLMSGKKVGKTKIRKHTFFIHSSGRFIQSSRNNASSLVYTANCMRLLHAVSADAEPPVVEAEEDEASTMEALEEQEEDEEEEVEES